MSSPTEKKRRLRQTMTLAEVLLWQQLRGRKFHDLKFRRQHGIGPYFADFYCASLSLVIEVDGTHHYTPQVIEYDNARTRFLLARNITVIRIPNREVEKNMAGVLELLEQFVRNLLPAR